jgi:hypothetical protein
MRYRLQTKHVMSALVEQLVRNHFGSSDLPMRADGWIFAVLREPESAHAETEA